MCKADFDHFLSAEHMQREMMLIHQLSEIFYSIDFFVLSGIGINPSKPLVAPRHIISGGLQIILKYAALLLNLVDTQAAVWAYVAFCAA